MDALGRAGGSGAGGGAIERLDLDEVPYEEAVERMTGWVGQRRAGEIPDRLALLTHPPVITYGSRTPPAELPADSPIPLVPVDRGGQATYHGPGQLIGYLVLNLRERGPADIVRQVEHALIDACATLGFETLRRDTPPGVPMTSLAELAAHQGRSVPSEQEVRDAVAKALGAA